MNPLTSRRKNRITEEQLTFALARQLGNMGLATRDAQAGIYEIAVVHSHASDKVAQTLATANQMVKAATYAGRVTRAKQIKLRRRTQEYLHEMLNITYDTGDEIIDMLMHR